MNVRDSVENPMIEDQARDDAAEDKRRREAPEVERGSAEFPLKAWWRIRLILEETGYYNSEDEDENGTYTWCFEPRAGFDLPKLRLEVESNG